MHNAFNVTSVWRAYLLGIGGVRDRTYKSVGIDDAVTAGNLFAVSLLLAVVVVGRLVVADVERKLVLSVRLSLTTTTTIIIQRSDREIV